MNKHTMDELKQWQALPLSIKIRMTETRIRMWVDEFGENGVYVSFSGGKDSTVLLDIVRNRLGYKNIPAVFVDVPTQYPELKEFATSFDNVVVLKPKISFMEVCEKYGFPLISKEVSECVNGARKYLTKLLNEPEIIRQTDRQTDKQINNYWAFADLVGIPRRQSAKESEIYTNLKRGIIPSEMLANILNDKMVNKEGGNNQRLAIMLGMLTKDKTHPVKANLTKEEKSNFSQEKYKFFLNAPFEISNECCKVMKKNPVHKYAKETGRMPITAQMADESRLRTQKWLQNGCNAFDIKNPISNPMSFWVENDVLQYIVENQLPICSVYGDVVEDFGNQVDGQLSFIDYDKKYKTTGCKRTGCMFCGFCCDLEESPNRFELLKETHPKMYNLLDVVKNNGVTMREAIDWVNKNGNMNIKY